MTSAAELRAVITGLTGFAAVQEQLLLAEPQQAEPGDASCWAALPTVAHNTDFARQQVQRLRAIRVGQAPPEFAEADHRSAALYAELTAQPVDSVARDSWRVTGELLEEVRLTASDDLLDASRHPWLRGRQLWLQVIVRGFWHPAGHLGEYYSGHGQADRALTLAEEAVALTAVLGAPDQVRGMASYNLGCVRAGAGLLDEAAAALAEAIALNPDVAANAARDPDLASVRDSGRMPAQASSA
jgi:tetratricopeptide (TPR) repeat protein